MSNSADRHSWAQTGAEEVADRVFRIPLPMPQDGLRAVNVYVIVGDDRITLIDSGWAVASSRDALAVGLGRLEKSFADIRQFLVTHAHADHYAQASVLREEIGARISIGGDERPNFEQTLRNIRAGESPKRTETLRRAGAIELLSLLSRPTSTKPELARQWQAPDEWLEEGIEVVAEDRRLRVVPTPGHTRGHVVFHEEQAKLLFSGDHILPHITPSIGLDVASSTWPLRDYIDSLKLIKSRPDAALLPAHGPVRASAHLRADELISHHEIRLNAALRAVKSGASTAFEVAKILKWTYHESSLDELNPQHQSMAVGEAMAHLDVLVLFGVIYSDKDLDGIEHYRSDRPEGCPDQIRLARGREEGDFLAAPTDHGR
jgi:glyoxylase-like metal-dependent hydrolase (beta-lactamase superfamily II)